MRGYVVWWVAFVVAFLPVVVVGAAPSLSGRWVDGGVNPFNGPLDGNGVYDVVENGTIVHIRDVTGLSGWKTRSLVGHLNGTSLTVTFKKDTTLTGIVLPDRSFIEWSTDSTWQRFGSAVQCVKPTFRSTHQPPPIHRPVPVGNSSGTTAALGGDVDVVPKRIHVVMMTHFDLGYTDFSWCTISHYFWQIYPGVALTASQDPGFKYTTHAWILYMFLFCDRLQPFIKPPPGVAFVCPASSVQRDIRLLLSQRRIVFHAFPFDGFNEMLGPDLYDLGFDIVAAVAGEVGISVPKTMINNDIPGVNLAQVSPMVRRGVKALYIGQNPSVNPWAGAALSLPPLFRWTPPGSTDSVVTMIHKGGYGGLNSADLIVDPTTREGLLVSCVIENTPPYTPVDVAHILAHVQREFPSAEVEISTHDAFVEAILPTAHQLPLVTQDIGDTWVRAAASDPKKTAAFKAMRKEVERCMGEKRCPKGQALRDVAFFLITACEHNWGLPVQGWYRTVLSAQEKRDYITTSTLEVAKNVSGELKGLGGDIVTALQGLVPHRPDPSHGFKRVTNPTSIQTCKGVEVGFSSQGAITHYKPVGGVNRAAADAPLGLLAYREHNLTVPNSAGGDPVPTNRTLETFPTGITLYLRDTDCTYLVGGSLNQSNPMDPVAQDLAPKPMQTWMEVKVTPDTLDFEVQVFGRAVRYDMFDSWFPRRGPGRGGSLLCTFRPVVTTPALWRYRSLGYEEDPTNFARFGLKHYNVADGFTNPSGAGNTHLQLNATDTPLFAFGADYFGWTYDWDSPAKVEEGITFNIWNQWNANWVLGYPWLDSDGDMKVRYAMKWGG